MRTALVGTELETPPDLDRGGGSPPNLGSGGDGDRRGGQERSYDRYQTLVWVLMVPVIMLFVGLTSSLVVRRGFSTDWVPISLPTILGWNTVILLLSSYTFEKARHAMVAAPFRIFQNWLWVTASLGTGFLIGQWIAWRDLAAQGVFLASNPSSSFFYVLTATHGTHLIGGIAALTYLTIRATRNQFGPTRHSALKATAVYWHFMDALWIYLLFVLIFWR